MTRPELVAMARQLAAELKIREPQVRFHSGRVSRAYAHSWTISIGLGDHHSLEHAMLHELAHLVVRAQPDGQKVRNAPVHDRRFYEALKAVIKTWWCPESKASFCIERIHAALCRYDWHQEYEVLYQMAAADGLTTTPHFLAVRRAKVAEIRQQRLAQAVAVTGYRPQRGDRVLWRSPRHGAMSGEVLSAYANCRAKVRTPTGVIFYVPQDWLKPLVSTATASLSR
jgi:hypothetical protein